LSFWDTLIEKAILNATAERSFGHLGPVIPPDMMARAKLGTPSVRGQ